MDTCKRLISMTICMTLVILGLSTNGMAQFGKSRGQRVVSPEVSDDGKVTFRILAPKAETVRLIASDIPGNFRGKEMTKDANEVWQVPLCH